MPVARLRLRKAVAADSRDVWKWRNDPRTRKCSLSTGRIPWEKHREWFSRVITHSRCHLYIAMTGRSRVAVLRHDLKSPKTVEVSINVNPRFRGQGFGKRIMELSNVLLRKNHPRFTQRAVIRPSNKASVKIFSAAGFIKKRTLSKPAREIWTRRAQ